MQKDLVAYGKVQIINWIMGMGSSCEVIIKRKTILTMYICFVDRIIGLDELPEEYRPLPDEYVTCRIYRWMIGYFYKGMTRCIKCKSEMIWDDEWNSFGCKCGMGYSAMWEANFKDRKME